MITERASLPCVKSPLMSMYDLRAVRNKYGSDERAALVSAATASIQPSPANTPGQHVLLAQLIGKTATNGLHRNINDHSANREFRESEEETKASMFNKTEVEEMSE